MSTQKSIDIMIHRDFVGKVKMDLSLISDDMKHGAITMIQSNKKYQKSENVQILIVQRQR
jgi:hypothetical protein